MHDLNIMHRDLKSANVFLYKDFTAKLGDMNVSKVANKRGLNYTQTGTPTMQVLKFGEMNHMTLKVISGHLVVSYMK